jgi:replicative DNA helicase
MTEVLHVEHDATVEQVLIVAALQDPEARKRLVSPLAADLFVDERHSRIWSALRDMHRRGTEPDASALLTRLGEKDAAYLRQLVEALPGPHANLTQHCASLRWGKARVEAARGPLSTLLKAIQDPRGSPEHTRAAARSLCTTLDSAGLEALRDPTVLAREHADMIRSRRDSAVYPLGFNDLDYEPDGRHRIVPGLAPSQVVTITGVSGSGKSTIVARIVLEQARRGRRVLYGAWEMGAGPTLELLAQMSLTDSEPQENWSRYRLATADLSDEQLEAVRARMEQIGQVVRFCDPPFQLDPQRRYDNDEALDVIHQRIAESGCEVAVFDLWERIIPDGSPEAERRALFRQQQIGQEAGVALVLVAQQRLKEVEGRADKRPTRGTIHGSGAWVEVSDTIIGVHRQALWKPGPDTEIELSVLKQRYGRWPLAVRFVWDGDHCILSDGQEIEYQHPTGERDRGDEGMAALGGKRR